MSCWRCRHAEQQWKSSLWPLAITQPGPTTSPGPVRLTGGDPNAPHPPDPAPIERIRLEGIWHRYSGAAADPWTLRGVDLSLAAGELLGLLGPSGCGKTTLLRLIAGFEQPLRGRIWIDGREVAGPGRFLAPERRGVGMVFQDYALFPHLDAVANARFGLRRGEASDRVSWLFALLGMEGLESRYPHELSGGQRQRLALARALAPQPSVVLLDEPFSNLDVEVRERLRSELPAVLAACGACGLLVTHDPQEALAIADRVAILNQGLLEQCASPVELVQRPATAFVGRFVLQANLLPARWRGRELATPIGTFELCPSRSAPPGEPAEADGGANVRQVPGDARADPARTPNGGDPPSGPRTPQLLLRPTDLEVVPAVAAAGPSGDGPWDPDVLPGVEVEVLGREFLGRDWLYQMGLGSLRLRVRLPLAVALERGERCRLALRPEAEPLLFPSGLPLRASSPGPLQGP
ncbi:MAG: ABC transporter ATP-binding protein [Cyanobacteria bacterium]|nr:ABC transporter ATP-binding protein [Cyanobacteriota bacterium]